jgi:asparagine synthetase B (glutamine-hydrolysing)
MSDWQSWSSFVSSLLSEDGKLVLAANGEIYKPESCVSNLEKYNFQTESDCEVILALYKEKGPHLLMKWMESSGLLFMMLTKIFVILAAR